jgi:hypothetical protein
MLACAFAPVVRQPNDQRQEHAAHLHALGIDVKVVESAIVTDDKHEQHMTENSENNTVNVGGGTKPAQLNCDAGIQALEQVQRIRLAHAQVQKLKPALARAEAREIGGRLFAEQAPPDLRITGLTIEARRGSFTRSIVDLVQAGRQALCSFGRSGHERGGIDYIGEWRSYSNFEIRPSAADVQNMINLMTDPAFHGSFAVMMIVRLDGDSLSTGAWLCDREGTARAIDVETG